MNRSVVAILAGLLCLSIRSLPAEELAKLPILPTPGVSSSVEWGTDYLAAIKQAKEKEQLLLVWFQDPKKSADNDKFAATVLGAAEVQEQLAAMTLVKLPLDAAIEYKEDTIKLLEHASFKELLNGPGLALIDLRDEEHKYYGWVVSIYPFQRSTITAAKLKILCELPAGSLTQRTLIFAVRTHAAAPQSAWSPHNLYLTTEAEKHSVHQASINLQGHHNWESRFHQINAGIGGGSSKEVCAESWPGQTLLDAAEECVHSWSQSPGHWAGVSARHSFFGYDMKKGTNGVWYATGIFASK